MNAIQLLKKDHETARQMFAQIEQAGAERRGQLWETLKPELTVHEELEATVLYGPIAQERSSDEELVDWNEHHEEEVEELEALIEEIGALDPAEAPWLEKIRELRQTLEHHIEEEEGDIWPSIERAWGDGKLDQAGQQVEALKRQMLRRAA
jgi:iron-sulfur cluster repair protein YtfE (RIC family)